MALENACFEGFLSSPREGLFSTVGGMSNGGFVAGGGLGGTERKNNCPRLVAPRRGLADCGILGLLVSNRLGREF